MYGDRCCAILPIGNFTLYAPVAYDGKDLSRLRVAGEDSRGFFKDFKRAYNAIRKCATFPGVNRLIATGTDIICLPETDQFMNLEGIVQLRDHQVLGRLNAHPIGLTNEEFKEVLSVHYPELDIEHREDELVFETNVLCGAYRHARTPQLELYGNPSFLEDHVFPFIQTILPRP